MRLLLTILFCIWASSCSGQDIDPGNMAVYPLYGNNETYGSGWNGDALAPEKDDIYDYLHQMDTNDDGAVDNFGAHASSHESGGSDALSFDSLADGTTYKKFLATERTKLSGVESGATADQTGAEIKTAYEAEADTNAYTDTEKSKLSGIDSGAEVNIQSDWNAVSGDAFILNKPSDITDLSGHAVTELSDVTEAGSGIIISSTERIKLSSIEDNAVALPVVDTTSVAKGSVDDTKLVRFEVDGLTPAMTRVLTVPDKDITIADNFDIPVSTTDLPEGTNLYYTEARVSANSDVAANTAKVAESTTVSAPLALLTYDISIPVATGSVNGYLSSTDWATFNNKQNGDAGLASLAGLTYSSAAFVKMTEADTFSLDTNTYLTGIAWGDITGTLSNQTDLQSILDGKEPALGNPPTSGYILSSTTAGARSWVEPGSGGMVYPGAGIALSTGSAWDTSITNNSVNWNTAYSERRQWDGGNTNLNASTGRSNLGLGATNSVQFSHLILSDGRPLTFLNSGDNNWVKVGGDTEADVMLRFKDMPVGASWDTTDSRALEIVARTPNASNPFGPTSIFLSSKWWDGSSVTTKTIELENKINSDGASEFWMEIPASIPIFRITGDTNLAKFKTHDQPGSAIEFWANSMSVANSYSKIFAINGNGLNVISALIANNVSITGGSISGITDLAILDGGTGASDAATARTNLGLSSMATQAANNVSITGGSISGISLSVNTDAYVNGSSSSLILQCGGVNKARLMVYSGGDTYFDYNSVLYFRSGFNGTNRVHISSAGDMVLFAGSVDAFNGFKVNGTAGVSGSFTTVDSKTVTVTKGIITAIN